MGGVHSRGRRLLQLLVTARWEDLVLTDVGQVDAVVLCVHVSTRSG